MVVRRLEEEGPGDETGGTANITTSARSFRLPAPSFPLDLRFHDPTIAPEAGSWKLELVVPSASATSGHVMSAKRAAGYTGGALLLLAWLASAGGLIRQEPDAAAAPSPPVETNDVAKLAAEVQAQTLRLKNRMAGAPSPLEPFRNPFAFADRPAALRNASPSQVEAESAPLPAPPLEPAIELIGVAETASAKGVLRTAIISAHSGELFLVKEGETLAARYRVGTVAADAVELNDLVTGAIRRLALRD